VRRIASPRTTRIALEFAQRAYVLIKGRVMLEDATGRLAQRADLKDLYFSLASARVP
jgi:ABC-type branched-subunit amino acid transport system ATPase component